jgi:hypothetical protein
MSYEITRESRCDRGCRSDWLFAPVSYRFGLAVFEESIGLCWSEAFPGNKGWNARSYGVEKGLISSFPIRTAGDEWEIVQKVPLNDFSRRKIDASIDELKEEKGLVAELLG